jgi:hypothetical protein
MGGIVSNAILVNGFESLKGRAFNQFQKNRLFHFDRTVECVDGYCIDRKGD